MFNPATPSLSLPLKLRHNTNNILIRHRMPQTYSLWNVSRTRPPHQRILERLPQRPVHLIAHILNRAIPPHNQRFGKVGLGSSPFRVHAHQLQFLPASLHHVGDAEIELAGHYGRVGFAGQGVEVREGDGVDFVVDVEAVGRGGE